MADTATTKKVTDLAENTDITDEDLFIAGSAGTASLRKVKWSNVWAKIMASILNKISANNLITTTAGYLLDARQGKALDDKISELNTKFIYRDKTYNSLTIGSKEVVMRYPDSVGGYTPVFAVAIAGTAGKYEWFAAQVTSAGNMLIENKFTGSITADVTVRIFYIKS